MEYRDGFGGKEENLGILQHRLYGTRRGNPYAAIEDPENIKQKSWKRAGFLCPATHRTASRADPP